LHRTNTHLRRFIPTTALAILAPVITGAQIQDGSLTNTDLSTTVISTLGGGGAAGFEVVTTASQSAAPVLAARTVNGTCPAGKVGISANAYSDGEADVAAPEVRRTGPSSFTAQDSFPIALVGAGKIQLQVTCLTAS